MPAVYRISRCNCCFGKMLLNAAIDGLADVPIVGLDATPAGKQLYDTLGFEDEFTLQRWICPAVPARAAAAPPNLRRAVPADLDEIVALDASTFGPARRDFLAALLHSAPSAYCLTEGGRVTAFCLGREGSQFYYAGPVIAPGFEAARTLIEAVFADRPGHPVMLDVPDSRPELIAWLVQSGFTSQRPLIRMVRKTESAGIPSVNLETLYAIAGPEFG